LLTRFIRFKLFSYRPPNALYGAVSGRCAWFAGFSQIQTVIADGLVPCLAAVDSRARRSRNDKSADGEDVALGRYGTFGYWVSVLIGKAVHGKKRHSGTFHKGDKSPAFFFPFP
jgi:ascorbate-specific PTS system EIIC-type component UlaA